MWLVILGLGWLAMMVSSALAMPPSRELVIKLGTLMDWARRANPAQFGAKLAAIDPFVEDKRKPGRRKFVHRHIAPVLRADLSEFGDICQRLQRESKKLDRKAHIGMIPMAVYALGVGLWFVLKS